MMHPKKLSLLFLFFVFCFAGISQTDNKENTILLLSKKKFDWMIQNKMDSLSLMLDNQVKYIHSNGWTQSKDEMINDFKSGKLMLSEVDIHESSARIIDHTAIVNGKGKFTGSINATAFSLELYYTEVYVQEHDKWMLVTRHASKLQ